MDIVTSRYDLKDIKYQYNLFLLLLVSNRDQTSSWTHL